MTKRFKIGFLFLFCAFLLTGCGAKVYTSTSFSKNGSGKRIVYLEISMNDEGRIQGGFQGLEHELANNAPSCVEISRHEDQNKSAMIYELKYEFSDIEDLRSKTKEITGTEPEIQWEEKEGAFTGTVSYSEKTTTAELTRWVKKTLQSNSISNAIINQSYEEADSKILYEGKQVWTGKENASFSVDQSPVLDQVMVYTSYKDDGKVTKQIKLGFPYEDYRAMDTEEGLNYLHRFSKKFKVDSTCNGYSVTLEGQKELEVFFQKASGELSEDVSYVNLEMQQPDKNYYFQNQSTYSIFTDKFSVKEVYNLNQLLSGFKISAKTIKDYVSIPKRTSYQSEQVHHTYAIESTDAYPYIGEYDIGDTYYLFFEGGKSVKLNKASASFSIDDDLLGTQTVTLKLSKEGIKLNREDVMEYYSNLGEIVQYDEEGEDVTITFTREFSYEKNEEEDDIRRINNFSLHKLKYQFRTDFSISDYFSLGTGKVLYTISLPASFKIEQFQFGNRILNRKELKEYQGNQQWTFQEEIEGKKNMTAVVDFSTPNMLFYGILSVVVLLSIGGGLSFYFYWKTKGNTTFRNKLNNETAGK